MKAIIISLVSSLIFVIIYIAVLAATMGGMAGVLSQEEAFLFLALVPMFFSLIISIVAMIMIIKKKMKTATKQLVARNHIVRTSKPMVVRDEYMGESVSQDNLR